MKNKNKKVKRSKTRKTKTTNKINFIVLTKEQVENNRCSAYDYVL